MNQNNNQNNGQKVPKGNPEWDQHNKGNGENKNRKQNDSALNSVKY
jgi:hypothetical protein